LQAVIQVEEVRKVMEARGRPILQDDFVTHYIPSLTHEVNNHLAAIRLAAELAATTAQPPDYEQMILMVDHCQEVLQTIVLQMLRAATPTITPVEVPYSELRKVIEQALLLTRPQVLSSGTQVQLKLPENAPRVAGFAYELQEAMVRIIAHSTKAMRDREPPRILTISANVKDSEGFVELTVTDSSEGLPLNNIAAINGRYSPRRGDQERTWELVRESLCRFGGRIHATNGLNGGARFRIELPIEES
jgi:signal transduction histidine kinase